jgi:hypothetical protein
MPDRFVLTAGAPICGEVGLGRIRIEERYSEGGFPMIVSEDIKKTGFWVLNILALGGGFRANKTARHAPIHGSGGI